MSHALRLMSLLAGFESLAEWVGMRADPLDTGSNGRRFNQRQRWFGGQVYELRRPPIATPPNHMRVAGLTLREAKELVQWLQVSGRDCSGIYQVDGQGYAVCFR